MKDQKNYSGKSKSFIRKEMLCLYGILLSFLLIIGCSQSKERMEEVEANSKASMQIADTVTAYMKDLATDTINGITHNFIRKAELKFKVKNVLATSKKIEDIVGVAGGYISSSEFTSSIHYTNSTRISKDSLLEQTYYTTTNAISLRVPSQRLDTVLRLISDLALFIDYRNLNSNDVKMKLFSNKLAENRYKNYQQKVVQKTATGSAKPSQVLNTEENLLEKQSLADEKRIESFELADQVNYSTVTLEVYQPASYLKQMLAVEEQIEPYQPSFFEKAGDAFINGFGILKNFILFLIDIWGLILFFVLIYFGIRKLVSYNKNRKLL